MLVVDLVCTQGHAFEGWFASGDDLAAQQGRGLLACPLCGDRQVTRRPSAPRLNVSGATAPGRTNEADGEAARRQGGEGSKGGHSRSGSDPRQGVHLAAVQAAWLEAAREVVRRTEDVGSRFADEARRIHHGEAPARAIRGQATAGQAQALQDEGIEIAAIPLPDLVKQTLQ